MFGDSRVSSKMKFRRHYSIAIPHFEPVFKHDAGSRIRVAELTRLQPGSDVLISGWLHNLRYDDQKSEIVADHL